MTSDSLTRADCPAGLNAELEAIRRAETAAESFMLLIVKQARNGSRSRNAFQTGCVSSTCPQVLDFFDSGQRVRKCVLTREKEALQLLLAEGMPQSSVEIALLGDTHRTN